LETRLCRRDGAVSVGIHSSRAAFLWECGKEGEDMYKSVLLVRNGCEGCSMNTCLGVLLAESLEARVTAVYVTGNFTWKELRNIYGLDELKWSGAGRSGKEALAAAERRKVDLANKALDSTEKMCSDRGIRFEKMRLSSESPLHGALKVAEEKRCDVIVTSIPALGLTKPLYDVKQGKQVKANGGSRVPVLFHHAM